jgi:hypothetical protein
MLFREIIVVYCENHMEHTNTLCGQNAAIEYVKGVGILLYPRDGTSRRLAGRAVPLGVSSGCLRAAIETN